MMEVKNGEKAEVNGEIKNYSSVHLCALYG
jgi:hypothetical protein